MESVLQHLSAGACLCRDVDAKRVYYLSMEFLMGRSLLNALNNLGVVDQYTEALREMGYKLEDLIEKARPAELEHPPCSCTEYTALQSHPPMQPSALRCCLITTKSPMTGLRWACDGSDSACAAFFPSELSADSLHWSHWATEVVV